MKTNSHKISIKIKVALVAMVLVLSAIISASYIAFAKPGGTSGPGGTVGGGGCAPSGKSTWVDTCWGGMWKKYYTSSNYVPVAGTTSGNVPGGAIVGCGDYGSYYRLGFERYNVASLTGTGQQVGLIRVSEFVPGGGKATYQGGDWDHIKSLFDLAKTKYNLPTDWSETGYFCWNDEWCDPTTETCADTPQPAPATYHAKFYARSTVSVDEQNDVPSISATSTEDPEDSTAYISFSTDYANVDVKFRHSLHYRLTTRPTPDHGSESWSENDTFADTVKTTWSISSDTGASNVGDTEWSLTEKQSKTNANLTDLQGADFVTVSLEPGETKTVCQRINYNPKYYSYKTDAEHDHHHDEGATNDDGTPKLKDDGVTQETKSVHDYWEWLVESSTGSAYSEACAIIYRPYDSDKDPYDPGDAGVMNTGPMFAGETTGMEWETEGESEYTRRLSSWESIVYLVKEFDEYDQSKVRGNHRSRPAGPCDYYNNKTQNYYCKHFEGEGLSFEHPDIHQYRDSVAYFVVPDHTGSKFCLSFGYKYQYWYGTSNNYPEVDIAYTHDSGKDYWRIYNASCRTIAKKPSVAIWNGSLMTPGGVNTSTATRYDTQRMNDNAVGGSDELVSTSSGGNRTLYGSWSEHLDVIKEKDHGHGSGSTLAIGNHSDLVICPKNVDLTISNADSDCNKLGYSQIGNNSTLHTKLNTYLRDNQKFNASTNPVRRYEASSSADVMNKLGNNMSGTTIIKYTGSAPLEITKNITTTGSYANIYELPQVIIFANGGVNIKSDVTRIDAWIITDGVIDTCSDKSQIYEGKQNGENNNAEATVHGIPGIKTCSKQLVFNGPVIANGLKLNRTFGADPLASIGKNDYRATFNSGQSNGSSGTNVSTKYAPAEVFNLRADTYLWAYAQAGRYDSSYTESYSRELPPRY